MARTEITKLTPDADGVALAFSAVTAAAAPDGHYVVTDGSVTILVKNANVSTVRNMTVDVAVAVDGVASPDRNVPVPASSTVVWRPKDVHRQPDGTVHLNFDHATDLTVAILD